jgi:hypothetical protein
VAGQEREHGQETAAGQRAKSTVGRQDENLLNLFNASKKMSVELVRQQSHHSANPCPLSHCRGACHKLSSHTMFATELRLTCVNSLFKSKIKEKKQHL